jgi:hypothetical protein
MDVKGHERLLVTFDRLYYRVACQSLRNLWRSKTKQASGGMPEQFVGKASEIEDGDRRIVFV